ncbi:MAG: GNAT family N-acetyltransferase [Saprospiraceae bacterium]|nr:GNAT family N-acetyltransferase [Saprospiraceae bacterium]
MIETERLYLVQAQVPVLDAIVQQDWPALSRLLGGVDFADNWYHFPEVFAWMRDYLSESPEDGPWWTYLIVHKQDVRLIGTCGFKGAPSIDGEVEIGYEIADNYQNRGLATETARALTEFAFAQSGVDKVIAQTLAEENASVRVLKKLGFEFVCAKIDIEDGEIWEWERGKVLSPKS